MADKSVKSKFLFCIHAGAGTISKSIDSAPYVEALNLIVKNTFVWINSKELDDITAIDVVEYAVKQLEDCELFNAGKGAVLAADGSHELDAAIMDGSTLACGSVSLIKHLKNPVAAARKVMLYSPHNFITGESAEKLAISHGCEYVEQLYFTTLKRKEQLAESQQIGKIVIDHDLEKCKVISNEDMKGTVGCVCILNGNIAAATSTGGMTNKLPGRIGDSPIIGAGTYANNKTCGISATGKGEEFIRHCAAFNVSAQIEYSNLSLQEAAINIVQNLLPEKSGGLIAVGKDYTYAMPFNSEGMFRGVCCSNGDGYVSIWNEEYNFNFNNSG